MMQTFPAVFLLLKNISVSNEEIAGGKFVFVCLRDGTVIAYRISRIISRLSV